MYDANGVASDDVYYELAPSEDGKFTFAVIANEEWINDANRAFPVTIDPQIVTSQNNLITKQTYYRYVYASSSTGSGVSYSAWYATSTENIKVSRSDYIEYKTKLTVKRKLIALMSDNIVSVKLVLTPTKSFSGYILCDGKWTYYNTASGALKINITNSFKSNANSFTVTLQADTYADMEFYTTGEAPRIEIQTLTDENVLPTKKTYALAGAIDSEINFSTGEIVSVYTDTPRRNSLLGLSIAHVHKKHAEDLHVGKNFRLNLHEQFENNDGTYQYTDAMGNVHGFKEYHYYFDDNGNKTYVVAPKDQIVVETSGRFTYEGKEVFRECKSLTGLKAITKIEEYIYSEYFEDRSDEERQYGEQYESYKASLSNYVAISYSGNSKICLNDYLATNSGFNNFLNDIQSYYLMTKAESDTYEVLIAQYNHATDSSGKEISAMQMEDIRNKSNDYLSQIKRTYKEYVNAKEMFDQCQLQTPINYLTDERIIKGYNKYGQLVKVYDRYGNYVVVEYERYDVSNLAKARIKQVYDNRKNCILFFYNHADKLSAIQDVNGRQIRYVYDDNGWLTEIKDDNGIHLELTYDASGNICIVTEKKQQLKSTLTQTNNTLSIVNESLVNIVKPDEMQTDATFESGVLSQYDFEFVKNEYQEMDYVLVTTDKYRERYVFGLNKSLTEYYLEENGVVTKAERYEYQSYWNGNMPQDNPRSVTKQAKKSSLHKYGLYSYAFEEGDSERTTLNQFNNAVRTQTSAIQMSADSMNTATTAVDYTYDDNQRLMETRTEITYSNPAKQVVSYKKYNYNANGDVVRTESYIEGEEYTTGKMVEETVYNEQGNVVKSFTYNSLDASSKFYTETQYDENGKILAEMDGTGENKTQFSYADASDVVREELLPNGSKLAYGRDYDDTVTAISQSTEDGEENSTQRVYRYGQLVEVRSGNNKVEYTYDGKRRLASIHVNGTEKYLENEYNVVCDDSCLCEYDEVQTVNANNEYVTVRSDKRGKVLSKKYIHGADTMWLKYVYDEQDRLASITESKNGNTVRTFGYTYDSLDRMLAYTEKESGTTRLQEAYTYDPFGNVKTATQSTGMVYEYTYSEDSTRKLEEISVSGLTVAPKYDILKRNKGKEIRMGAAKIAEEQIAYRKVGDHTTNMPSTIRFGNKINDQFVLRDSVKYAYDEMGNIAKVYENGKLVVTYEYDKLNRLVRENNKKRNETQLFAYDNNGNILLKEKYAYTVKAANALGEAKEIHEYCYKEYCDALLSIIKNTLQADGTYEETIENFVYDGTVGNPTTYRGKEATWENGRRLASYDGHTFIYDGQGRRLAKDNVSFTYDSQGRVIKQSNGLEFFYDHTGVAGLRYNDDVYVYRKDAQGNIIAIIDKTGTVVVEYTYDAWGNSAVEDISGIELGERNPFRYRGYYYDTETELYFLKTRYFDPVIGRFMTIDSIAYLNPNATNGLNLYAYCNNNPVMRVDPTGNAWWNTVWDKVKDFASDVYSNVVEPVVNTVTNVVSNIQQDINNFNWSNTSASKVVASNYFSAYEGRLYIKLPTTNFGGLSLGVIFIDRAVDNNTVMHEYGHTKQLEQMGLLRYLIEIGIPSLTGSILSNNDQVFVNGKWISYYSLPWEYDADKKGKVIRIDPITNVAVKEEKVSFWDLF